MAGVKMGATGAANAGTLWQRADMRRLAVLVAAAVACAIIQVIWHPGDEAGLLGIGLGLTVGFLADRSRLLIAAALITPVALVNVLWTARVLRLDINSLNLLAVAAGLLLIAWGARAGYVGRGPFSPGLVVGLIGLLILGLTRGAAPGFYAWLVSLWAPVVLLPLVGLAMLAAGFLMQRGHRQS
ncbi:MAG TPA: hypothetical protein VIG30_14470 [Ktedonobacterales bacterium]|jgi:hypothetical protein